MHQMFFFLLQCWLIFTSCHLELCHLSPTVHAPCLFLCFVYSSLLILSTIFSPYILFNFLPSMYLQELLVILLILSQYVQSSLPSSFNLYLKVFWSIIILRDASLFTLSIHSYIFFVFFISTFQNPQSCLYISFP